MEINRLDTLCGRCSVCRYLDKAVPLEHGFILPLVRQTRESGCKTCSVIADAVQAMQDDEDPEEAICVGWDTMRIQGLRIVVGRAETAQFLYSIDMFAAKGHSVPWRCGKHGETAAEISGDTSSIDARKTVQSWMEACSREHSCKNPGSVHLPKRILDVRDADHVFLYCPPDDEVGMYACLSHCWGHAQTLRTTLASIAQHREEIPTSDMPRTFRDAATVASSLGIPYLWIDSLCIIQDSEQDWQAESAKMSDIYANSTVTIAASLASSDSEGLFSKSPPCHKSTPIRDSLYIRRTLGHGHGRTPLPLMRRAWALQERLLSPRVLHFTPGELIWECMERTTCECGCIRSLWSPGHVPFDKDLLYSLGGASVSDVRSRWRRLVEEYSRLELTLVRDRLPAVSGAARKFAGMLGRGYVAGLWRGSLVRDMLWERKVAGGEARRVDGMPSWSWASVCFQVLYEEAMATEEMAVVLDVMCEGEGVGGDEFGEISGGVVRLSTTLREIVVFRDAQGGMFARLSWEDEESAGVGVVIADGELASGACLFCARMALRKAVYSTGSDQEMWLLLDRGDEVDTFRRVGLLKVSTGDGESLVGEESQDSAVVTIT